MIITPLKSQPRNVNFPCTVCHIYFALISENLVVSSLSAGKTLPATFPYMYIYFCFRWRRSFLFSLIFGVPTFVIFITYVILDELEKRPNQMILPGLSLENLLMFILCTPVQVSINYKCTSVSGQVFHTPGACPTSHSIKRLGVFFFFILQSNMYWLNIGK